MQRGLHPAAVLLWRAAVWHLRWFTPWQGQQTNTLGILTKPVPTEPGGRHQPRCHEGRAWAGAVALDLSVPEEAGLSRASHLQLGTGPGQGPMHCLCLSAENNGNSFNPVLGISARWCEFSITFPFFLLCSLLPFISGSHMPAVVCLLSPVGHKLSGLFQNVQYPLALKWLTHGFRGEKNFQVALTMKSYCSLPCPSYSVRWGLAAWERAVL